MKPAECLRRILLFEQADYIPHYDAGPMGPDVEKEWHSQGLPAGQSTGEYFQFVSPIRVYGRFGKS